MTCLCFEILFMLSHVWQSGEPCPLFGDELLTDLLCTQWKTIKLKASLHNKTTNNLPLNLFSCEIWTRKQYSEIWTRSFLSIVTFVDILDVIYTCIRYVWSIWNLKKYFYVFLVDLKMTIKNNSIYSFTYWYIYAYCSNICIFAVCVNISFMITLLLIVPQCCLVHMLSRVGGAQMYVLAWGFKLLLHYSIYLSL